MGTINIYKGIGEEVEVIKGTGVLKDLLPEYDFSHFMCIKGGHKITADYIVKEKDIIFMRAIPGAGVTLAGAIALTVWGLAVTGIVGTAIGTAISNEKEKKAKEAAEKAQRDANNLAAKIEQLPFLRGAKNRKALGNSIQYIMGEVYNTPYLLTDGYYTISANGYEQYWNAVFSLGFGKQGIDKVYIGNETVLSSESLIEDTGNSPLSFDTGSVYYDSANFIEIKKDGNSFINAGFETKVVSENHGKELKHDYGNEAEPVVIQAASCTKKVEVCIQFNGLRKYSPDSETWGTKTVSFDFEWSNDGGTTWNDFYTGSGEHKTSAKSHSFTKNTNRTYRVLVSQTFDAEDTYGKNILIKVTRTNPKEENNTTEDAFLLFTNCFCYDNQNSDSNTLYECPVIDYALKEKLVLMAVRIKANDNTKDVLDEISVMSHGKAGNNYTRNPGDWVYELMTSSVHPHSAISPSEINSSSFSAFKTYCNNNFYCDGIITAGKKKSDIINSILSSCNATLIIGDDGRYEIAADVVENNPIALLNEECIKSVRYTKKLNRVPDGVKINFTDRETWQIGTRYVMLDGGTKGPDDSVTEITLDYVTDAEHVYKVGQRTLRHQQLQPREIQVDVGREGDYYPLYSTVLLQMKQLRVGLCSTSIRDKTVYGGLLTKIEVSDVLSFGDQQNYGVIIYAVDDNGRRLIYSKVLPIVIQNGQEVVLTEWTGTVKTKKLSIRDTVRISSGQAVPSFNNVVSFGYLDTDGQFSRITNVMKIYGVKPNADGTTLTLKDYNPDLYTYGTIPVYKSNITIPPQSGSIPQKNVSMDDVTDAIAKSIQQRTDKAPAQQAYDMLAHGIRTSNIHYIDGDAGLNMEEILARIDEVLKQSTNGINISETEMSIVMKNTEKGLYSSITQTAEEIRTELADSEQGLYSAISQTAEAINLELIATAQELSSAINVQAGAIGAFVTGGGTRGHLSLSLELPAIADATMINDMKTACGASLVNAVYIPVSGTNYFTISGTSTIQQQKALWDKAVQEGFLSSQIELDADIVKVDGTTIFEASKTYADGVASDAESAANSYADGVGDDIAIKMGYSDAAHIGNDRDAVAKKIGYASWSDMISKTTEKGTIISGGMIRTSLIDADSLVVKVANVSGLLESNQIKTSLLNADKFFAQTLVMKDGGSLESENFARNGGWQIKSNGDVTFRNGTFNGTVNASGGTFTGTETVNGILSISGVAEIGGRLKLNGLEIVSNSCRVIDDGTFAYKFTSLSGLIHFYEWICYWFGNKVLAYTPNSLKIKVTGKIVIDSAFSSTYTGSYTPVCMTIIIENGSIDNTRALVYMMSGLDMYMLDTGWGQDDYLWSVGTASDGTPGLYSYGPYSSATRKLGTVSAVSGILMFKE
ncbi:MAG: hypothetical protein K6A15_09065 [Treponema sp.]|nr:hypothetical protein [Treponema sp.]